MNRRLHADGGGGFTDGGNGFAMTSEKDAWSLRKCALVINSTLTNMALIQCPDCSNTISDTASACPHCGAPLARAASERAAIGVPLNTIQETSKRLKAQVVASTLIGAAGLIWILAAMKMSEWDTFLRMARGGIVLWCIGLIWLIVTKFRIWWHHG